MDKKRCAVLLLMAGWLGCQGQTETAVGALCQTNADCYSPSKKQVCALSPPPDGQKQSAQPRICSRVCTDRTACPIGFECVYSDDAKAKLCFPCRADYDCPAGTYCIATPGADGGAGARSCQQKSVPQQDFGKDCSVMGDAACGSGFFCHQEILDDPDAYCTRKCSADYDCPATMFCGAPDPDNLPAHGNRCLLKTLCSSCRSDAECPGQGAVCVPDNRGRGYCTHLCNPDSSMPCTIKASSRGWLECDAVAPDPSKPDQTVNACVPRYGRCYSAGAVCDPCRPHTPGDCQMGTRCVHTPSGEGLCTVPGCASDNDCPANAVLDVDTLHCLVSANGNTADKYCTAAPRPSGYPQVPAELTCWP